MITELHTSDFPKVLPLFRDMGEHLVVRSILEGHTLGRVFADDMVQPRSACVWSTMDAMLLAGDPDSPLFNAAFNRLLHDELIPDAQARGFPFFSVYLAPNGWVPRRDTLLRGAAPETVARRMFRLAELRVDWRMALPATLTLARMDAPLLARTDLANLGDALGWVRSFWPSVGRFVREGVGYCVLDGTAVASWCLSVYAAGDALELGVATAVSHRGQGLATVAAAAVLEHCLSQQIIPHWHCDLVNRPSVRVAEKLGFVPAHDYEIYRVSCAAD